MKRSLLLLCLPTLLTNSLAFGAGLQSSGEGEPERYGNGRVRIQRRVSQPAPVSTSGAVAPQPAAAESPSYETGRVRVRRRQERSEGIRTAPVHRSAGVAPAGTYYGGSAIAGQAARTRVVPRSGYTPPSGRTSVVYNPDVVRHIERRRRYERYPYRYYWHHVNGFRYCHTYWGNAHWYGFYHGPSFYWTRYHGGRFWWLDASFNRWVYWSDGYWLWPAPTGVTYIYSDSGYVPYNGGRSISQSVDAPPIPESLPPVDSGGTWESPDKKRRVEVFGESSEAFLYDITGKEPVYLTRLAGNVESVRFSGGGINAPSQILVNFKDGTFALFSSNGERINNEGASRPIPGYDYPIPK